jgi:AAA domain
MPSIEQQKPPRKVKAESNGSILSEAIDIQDLIADYIKIAIYGANRVGKTYIASKFPKPLLLISFEPGQSGGAKTAKAEQGVSFIHIVNKGEKDHRGVLQREWASTKAVNLANELRVSCPFKTIVLDTVTSFQDLILQEILDLPQVVDQLNWGMVTEDQYRQRSERTREVLRPFINIDAHTVFLAQMKDHNAIRGDRSTSKMLRGQHSESFFSVDLGGATAKWLQDSCDYITHLFQEKEVKLVPGRLIKIPGTDKTRPGTPTEVETGKMLRRLRTMFHPNYMAGCRSEVPLNIPEFIEVPSEVEGKRTDIFERIERLVIGVKQQKAEGG